MKGGITFPNKIIDVGNKVERRHGFKSHENLFNENKIIIFQEEIKYEKNIMVLVAFIYTM